MSTSKARRAAIYCRISSDRDGDRLGVGRQEKLCRDLVAARGWTVAAVYVDDDVSAYSGRKRPAFEAMREAIEAGAADAVVAVDQDRLWRLMTEIVRWIEWTADRDLVVVTTSGDTDTSTADGILQLHVKGAFAENESRKKSERIKRQRDQAALEGIPNGGGRRPFGYTANGAELVDDEAVLVREAVDRVLDGDSLYAIATDWNRRGIKSSTGGRWSVTSLRTCIAGTRIAGLRTHGKDEETGDPVVVGPAAWPAIITADEHARIRARLKDPRVHRVGRPPVSLLGGLIRCGRCGGRLVSSRYPNGARRYMCPTTPQGGTCGGLAIVAEPVEELVVDAVLAATATAKIRKPGRAKPAADGDDVETWETRLAELADLFADGSIGRAEWMRARDKVEAGLRAARATRDRSFADADTARWAAPGALAAAWPQLTTDQRRQALTAIVDRVVIAPSGPARRFDPARVSITWRT
jgi:DNA invertase Pin-like site-specific DNA recombinase